jgi:phytoene dehydrogenase-like protein
MILLLILAVGCLAKQTEHLQAPVSPTPQSQVHDVIIIGAGVSGIAASKALSDKGTPHLILEARDRIGGRIVSSELDGTQVDLGATFIHNPGNDNMVDQVIKQMNWETIPAKPYLVEYHYKNSKKPTSEEL